MIETMKEIIKFYEKLGDDESKEIFKARLKFFLNRNVEDFYEALLECYSDWQTSFGGFYKRRAPGADKKIVIYGYGRVGRFNKKLLEKCGYTVDYVVDRNYKKIFFGGG